MIESCHQADILIWYSWYYMVHPYNPAYIFPIFLENTIIAAADGER